MTYGAMRPGRSFAISWKHDGLVLGAASLVALLESQRQACGYGSFYSGHCAHTTGALAVNAMMGHQRGRKAVWPWMLVAGGVTPISAARLGAGRHFYTDVVAGSVAGAVIGAIVPRLHRLVPGQPD